jgi:hypothetical protein
MRINPDGTVNINLRELADIISGLALEGLLELPDNLMQKADNGQLSVIIENKEICIY